MKEVESMYMNYYSKLTDEQGNSPVVCLDPFTGWHVIREMTPEFFKEFGIKQIELNSNGNNYLLLTQTGTSATVTGVASGTLLTAGSNPTGI